MRPVELLLQYQKLGDRLSTLTDERDHLESRLARDEASERALAILAETQERQSELASRLRAVEAEVEGHRAKMKGHERELMSGRIRSPSDLMKMNDEVGHMKAALAEEEDSELELMTDLESADAELSAAKAELAAAQAAHAAAEPGMRERLAAIAAQVAEVEAERESLWEGVPEPLRAAYRKASRIPNPVVAEEGGQCMGCRVQLTANELQLLRRGERFTCQNCNRILVLN